MGRLDGKRAVITGSSKGIGRATAMRFAAEGAAVIVNDHGAEPELGPGTVAAITAAGGEARYVRADVRYTEQVDRLIAAAVDSYGGIDILMNNAYAGSSRPVTEADDAEWREHFEVVLLAAVAGCRAAIPHMVAGGGGSIINISSVQGLLGARRWAAYDTFKGALLNFTRQLAVDYGPDGVRVNAICPGYIAPVSREELIEQYLGPEGEPTHTYPLRRPGSVDEVAAAALFLASDEASFVTGHALVVDGGLTCQLQDSLVDHVRSQLEASS